MKTKTNNAAAKVSAPKTASAKLAAQLTVTETNPAGEPMKTTKTPPTKPQLTVAEVTAPPKRKTLQERLKTQNQVREYNPMPLDVLTSHIAPEYRAVYETMKKTNDKREAEGLPRIPYAVQIEPSPEYIYYWCDANGLNRHRDWRHALGLGAAIRDDFDPSCTHWCLTSSLAVSNGGHSGPAVALGLMHVLNRDDSWADVKNAKGEVIGNWGDVLTSRDGQTISVKSVFGTDDDPEDTVKLSAVMDDETAKSYEDYYRYYGRWRVNVILDAPDDSFLKMEDLRLNMSVLDVISRIPAMADILGEIDLRPNTLMAIIRQAWLRCSPSGLNNYGNCSIGGKLPAKTAPARFGLFIDDIQDSLATLKKAMGGVIKLPETLPEQVRNGLTKDIVLTMTLLSDANREKVCKFITSSTNFAKLTNKLIRPVGASGWTSPKTDWMISAIISMSQGASEPPTDDEIKAKPEVYRGDYWDRGLDHPTRGSLNDAYLEVAKQITDAIDDPDLLEEVKASIKNRANNAKAKAKKS